MTERTASGGSERATAALRTLGMSESPIATLEREDALFVLTGQTLLYQDGGGTRRVTLRDLTRIHSDDQGLLRVETPAGTALTATLLGFDVGQVQQFFKDVRAATLRVKELPASPLPSAGGAKTFSPAPQVQAVPAPAMPAQTVPTPQPAPGPAPAREAKAGPAPAGPAPAQPTPPAPTSAGPGPATPERPTAAPTPSPATTAAAAQTAPTPVPGATTAPATPPPSAAPASLSTARPAAATPPPKASAPTPSTPAKPAPTAPAPARPAEPAPVVISSSGPHPATRADVSAPAPVTSPAGPAAVAEAPAPVPSALARQATVVAGLAGRLRFLGGVLFVAAVALAAVRYGAGERLDALWGLLAGGVGAITLLALAEALALLAALARVQGAAPPNDR